MMKTVEILWGAGSMFVPLLGREMQRGMKVVVAENVADMLVKQGLAERVARGETAPTKKSKGE